MKRRVLVFLIAVSVLLFQNITGLAYYNDINGTDYEKPVNVLSALGILNGYDDGTFKSDNDVTRAEFVNAVIRFLNLQDITNDSLTYYNDVEKDYWALSVINTATGLGIIKGMDDGNFYPDDNITITDAAKIIVSALGYNVIAEQSGGYPQGYLKLASDLEILDDVKGTADGSAKRGDVAVMLYNALEVKQVVKTSAGYEKSNQTVLNGVHKVQKREGIVNCTKYAKMVPIENLGEDEIAIDSVVYKINDSFLHELVGYKISFYAQETADDEYTIIYYEVSQKNSKSVIIWADKLLEQSDDSKLVYEDEKGKTINAKINTEFVVINGQSVKYTGSDMFNIDEGSILLIDSDNNGIYETVIINKSETLVVDRINTTGDLIYYKYSGNKYKDLTDKDIDIYKNGEKLDFSELKEWDVLTVYESPDGKDIIIYVSDAVIDVTVASVLSTDDELEIRGSDGETYKGCFKYCRQVNEGADGTLIPKSGAVVSLHLDVNGEVAAISSSQLTSEGYALLIKAYKEEGGSVLLRIMNENGEVKTMLCADTIKVDDGSGRIGKYSEYDALLPLLESTKIPDEDGSLGDRQYQLITYRTNNDGKIDKITLAKRMPDYTTSRDLNRFTLDWYSSAAVSNGSDIFGGAYRVPQGEAKVFYVPNELEEYEKYTTKPSFVEKTKYKCALYDMDDHNYAAAAVVFQPSDDAVTMDVKYNPYYTVNKTIQAVNDDGDIIYRVYCMYNRKMTTIDFEKDPGFVKGDVYQMGFINGELAVKQKIYDASTDSYAGSGAADPGKLTGSGPATDEVMLAYLEVKDVTDSTLVVTDGEKEWMLLTNSSQTRCTLFYRTDKRADVRNVDVSEICIGDRVVVRTFKLTAGDVVIIR